MRYFTYWAKSRLEGPEFPITCWGFSNESTEAAKAAADAKAMRTIERLQNAPTTNDKKDYYHVDPLKERVIEEIALDEKVIAVVTRNAYGALILNTSQVPFLDIDLSDAKKNGALVSLWKRLIGSDDDRGRAETLAHLTEVLSDNERYAGKIYETANGFRILITSEEFSAEDPNIHELMEKLGVDELYRRLCLRQQGFRARLTAKPWRVGMARPPVRYPIVGDYSRTYRVWLEKYEARASKYRVCRLVGEFGNGSVCAAAKAVLGLHDRDLGNLEDTLA